MNTKHYQIISKFTNLLINHNGSEIKSMLVSQEFLDLLRNLQDLTFENPASTVFSLKNIFQQVKMQVIEKNEDSEDVE